MAIVAAFACTPPRSNTFPGREPPRHLDLATLMICTDTLGRIVGEKYAARCLPCLPAAGASADSALRHVRRLAIEAHTLNFNESEAYGRCLGYGYRLAEAQDSAGRMQLRAEAAVWDLFALNQFIRAEAIRTVDVSIDTVLVTGDSITPAEMLETLGIGVWDRAQRLLARATTVRVVREEWIVHDIGSAFHSLRHIPAPPHPSATLGESEAVWAREIFLAGARLVPGNEALRSRLTRHALATFVVREQWNALDSAARDILQRYPHDSVAPVARALARFRQVQHPVLEYPMAMAMFDSALRVMPSADSAMFDNFDEMLKRVDDLWRHEHLPGDRAVLDARSWSLFDPIWLTPVNELHLVRRARLADANFRYAYLAKPGQSGSQLPIGIVLLRRGVPSPRWQTVNTDGMVMYQRTWPGGLTTGIVAGPTPNAFLMYADAMTLPYRIELPLGPGRSCHHLGELRTLFLCARHDDASWHDVPFEGKQDTVDVTAARFRTATDSVDYYYGARIPLRTFPHVNTAGAARTDSIVFGATVATAAGIVLDRQRAQRGLPGSSDIAFTAQWRSRVPKGDVMHRIEAYQPRSLTSARGTRMLTSTGAATFLTTSFGMSDVLVADSIADARQPVRTWRDLRTVPNGATIEPKAGIAMGWEIYNLTRGADGRSRWRVTLSREDGRQIVNMEMRSLIVGDPAAGVKVRSNEPDAALLSYTRNEPTQPVMVEYIRFNMPDVGEGRHVLRVRIEDMESGRITQKSVSVRVLNPKKQSR